MSKFNSYMAKADSIAKEAFAEIQKAEAAFKAAEQHRRENPAPRRGVMDAAAAARAARAEADFMEAKSAYDKSRRELPDTTMDKLAAIRRELEAAVSEAYRATPEDVDPATMTLLQSGILTPAEYESLLDGAIEKDNPTMARIIGKNAETAAEKFNRNDPERLAFMRVAHRAKDTGSAAYLSTYDGYMDVVRRCLRTSGMIANYDGLVGEAVRNF